MHEIIVLYTFLVLSVLISGVVKGGFGGGGAFVSTLILALVMPPAEAVSFMLLIFIFMDHIGMVIYRFKWRFRVVLPLMGYSIIGVMVGWLLFDFVDEGVIKLLMVFLVLFYWSSELLSKALRGSVTLLGSSGKGGKQRIFDLVCGVISGFSSFVANAGGPSVTIYLLSKNLSKSAYQGCSVIFFWWVNLIKLFPFISLGLYDRESIFMAIEMLPVAVVGMALGVYLHKRVSEKGFMIFLKLMLFLVSLKLLFDALLDLGIV